MKFSYLGPQAISVADFGFLSTAMCVRNQKLGAPPKEGTIFETNQFYQYISNVPVHSGPAQRPTWRQHITVTALIVPRIKNVKERIA